MQRQSGSSLLEVMVTILLSSMLAAMAAGLVRIGVRAQHQQESAGVREQAVATAFDLLTREIATAGCAAMLEGHPGLRLAEQSRLQLTSDRNADGDTEDANERITYALNDDRGLLTRASGAGSPQTLLRGVTPAGLRFRYLYTSGELAAPGSDETTLRRITAIRVEVTLAGGEVAPATFQRLVALRNHGAG